MAGVAGSMFALFSTYHPSRQPGLPTTILMLTMVVVGGLGSIGGAVGGAIVFGLISEVLRQSASWQEIIYGGSDGVHDVRAEGPVRLHRRPVRGGCGMV